MKEADAKRKAVDAVRLAGGYAKRIEDKYSVGFPDTILKLPNYPTALAEFKLVRGRYFSPTPRQLFELKEYQRAGGVSLVIGYNVVDDMWYFSPPTARVDIAETYNVFHDFTPGLEGYLNANRT